MGARVAGQGGVLPPTVTRNLDAFCFFDYLSRFDRFSNLLVSAISMFQQDKAHLTQQKSP
jgi:hypothetical protein